MKVKSHKIDLENCQGSIYFVLYWWCFPLDHDNSGCCDGLRTASVHVVKAMALQYINVSLRSHLKQDKGRL